MFTCCFRVQQIKICLIFNWICTAAGGAWTVKLSTYYQVCSLFSYHGLFSLHWPLQFIVNQFTSMMVPCCCGATLSSGGTNQTCSVDLIQADFYWLSVTQNDLLQSLAVIHTLTVWEWVDKSVCWWIIPQLKVIAKERY